MLLFIFGPMSSRNRQAMIARPPKPRDARATVLGFVLVTRNTLKGWGVDSLNALHV